MGAKNLRGFWELVEAQYSVVTRVQLLELGLSAKAIKHWVAVGRLFPVWRGVYAVGRPGLSREGRWLAATLACGSHAMLSHGSAAALWGIGEYEGGQLEVSVPAHVVRRRPGIRVWRRASIGPAVLMRHKRIPLTSPSQTLVDLTPRLSARLLDRAVNEAANRDLVAPDALRADLEGMAGQRGIGRLRDMLDRRTFRLTDSDLERFFLPLARRAGLPVPETRVWLNGFRVDFYWPTLGLVVETDSLRYHRTPAQQARDRLRDQRHAAAGLTPVRFTHEQVSTTVHTWSAC